MSRIDHAEASSKFIEAKDHLEFHDRRLWDLRKKRDAKAKSARREELRSLASAIKEHTLSHLADYLEEFERNAKRNGAQVHWAKDAAEHNQIVFDIMSSNGASTLVKAKSMLTDECDMRPFLENRGIEVMETDLGERIQQLDDEPPSHIVVPAVHKLRGDVARCSRDDRHRPGEQRRALPRRKPASAHAAVLLRAGAGMTGANFAGGTGTVVVCTNEGNADLSVNLPKLYIASIGIEKIIPRIEHLGVFVRMLSQRARLADHAAHLAFPRPARRHADARDPGRQRALRAAGHGRLLVLAEVHPLRRLHEHLPGVPPQRRSQLRRDLLRADRRHHRPDVQPAKVQLAAVRLDAQWQLHQRLSGQDQHPRADLQMARDHRRASPASVRQAGSDACRGQGVEQSEAVPRSG